MKRLLFIVSVFLTTMTYAQSFKFGHVDTESFISQLPAVKEVQKTLDAETSKIESTVATLNQDFQKMLQDYQQKAESMTEAERIEKETQLQEAYEKVQQFIQVSRQQITTKQQELMAPIIQKFNRAIQEIGVENGFIYIFEEKAGVTPYTSASKSVDVTPLLKKKFGIN